MKQNSLKDRCSSLTQLKSLRPCKVRLVRIVIDRPIRHSPNISKTSNPLNFKNIGLLTKMRPLQPCVVLLQKTQINKRFDNRKNKIKSSLRSHSFVLKKTLKRADAIMNNIRNNPAVDIIDTKCGVVLEKLKYAEIEVTTPSEGLREVTYTVKTEANLDTSSYEDYISETLKIMPKSRRNSSHSPPKTTQTYWKLPLELSSIFDVNSIKDKLPSILSVLSGDKMTSLTLDAYLTRQLQKFKSPQNFKTISRRSASSFESIKNNFQYLSILYFPIYKIDQDILYRSCPATKFSPKFKLQNDSILIAPQLTCQHFYLSVFDFPTKIVHVYDSCWNFVPLDLRFKQVQTVLKHLLEDNPHLNSGWEEWSVNFLEKCAQQTDEVNCGCYVIHFTENLLAGKTETEANLRRLGKNEIGEIRRKIVRDLLPTTKLGKQILEAITE